MGNLVFQATLGGQVNLVGPNTASTFNINVPALSGTMASIASVNNNGVIYVNSSGQPTTGTALVFDGTNLGVGQAPSAWLSSFKSLDIGTTSSFAYFNSGTYVYNNFYYNSGGNPVYKGNGYAQAYVQNVSGQHVWNIAGNNSSGAGASCTFTQAMTLDASGQLGIGATSPAGVLHATNGASPASRIIVGGGGGAASTLYTLLAAGNYIEFDTGEVEKLDEVEYVNNLKNIFTDWECTMGLNHIFIKPNGDIKHSACNQATVIGNLESFEFAEPQICKIKYCTCTNDVTIPKRKV